MESNYIEVIHQENLSYIRALGAAAIAEINKKADDIECEMDCDHFSRMEALEYEYDRKEEERSMLELFAPFKNISQWFDNLPKDTVEDWQEIYQEYRYGPDGDMILSDDDELGFQIMELLQSRDSYLKQPFCMYCDSRGHKDGDCIPRHLSCS